MTGRAEAMIVQVILIYIIITIIMINKDIYIYIYYNPKQISEKKKKKLGPMTNRVHYGPISGGSSIFPCTWRSAVYTYIYSPHTS